MKTNMTNEIKSRFIGPYTHSFVEVNRNNVEVLSSRMFFGNNFGSKIPKLVDACAALGYERVRKAVRNTFSTEEYNLCMDNVREFLPEFKPQ